MSTFSLHLIRLSIIALTLFASMQNIRANEIVKLDRIVAIVNQGVITEQELVSRMQSVSQKFAKSGQELPPDNILTKQILDRLIIDSLQLQYAEKTGIKIPPEQVNSAIERIAEQNQLTVTEFSEALTKDGLNMTSFKKDIKNEITMARLRDRQINSQISVTETEIDNLLTTQAANPDAQDEYEIAHIMINTPEEAAPDDVKKAQEKADKAFSELQKGVAFSKVSAKYSDSANALEGGSLGWKKSTQIPILFLNALKPLSKGEHSTILRSPNGFHILQLTDKRGENATLVIEQTHARHILIKLSEIMSDSEAKRKIDELKIRLDNNENFETLARQYSDDGSAANGGDLGWINPGDTVPPFEKAMNALAVNEISEPVKSQFGWHIIQVLEKRNQDMTKEAKRLKARQEIQARKSDEAYEEWIRELRDSAFVDLKLVDEY